jgi:transcriptional regulator with XRE-family HTH domain
MIMKLLEAIRAVERWSDGGDEERPRDAIAELRGHPLKDMLHALDDLEPSEYDRLAAFATSCIGGCAALLLAADAGHLPVLFARERAGMSQEALAGALGVSVSTVRRWESADARYWPSPAQAARIDAFGAAPSAQVSELLDMSADVDGFLTEQGILDPEDEWEPTLDYYRDQASFDAAKDFLRPDEDGAPPYVLMTDPGELMDWDVRSRRHPLDVPSYSMQNAAVLAAAAVLESQGRKYSIAIR